jgi:DNA topoisomerase IB
MTKEEKVKIKEEKDKQEEPFLYATIDGRKERVGNFRVEPPGLFRGRGEHPKMGKLKKRIMPKDVIINIGEKAPTPPCPIPGHKWGEVLTCPCSSFSRTLNCRPHYISVHASAHLFVPGFAQCGLNNGEE